PLSIIYCANAVGSGRTVAEALHALKGREFLDLLKFSFESSLNRLNDASRKILFYLSLSRLSRTRGELSKFVQSDVELDDSIRSLVRMSFVRRTSEERKRIRFEVDNPLLKDYVVTQATNFL